MTARSLPINPGKGLGFLALGGSLHDIFNRLKAHSDIYPCIQVSYSSNNPVQAPVVLNLPDNGLRLQFDGADQRLRLIEILDFAKSHITYKGTELVRPVVESVSSPKPSRARSATGPAFRQVYNKLFGPTFAGEYFPPSGSASDDYGSYILSYPGLAFSFAVQHAAWSPSADFVTLLSSPASLPAHSLAIFNGSSWKEARQDILTRPSSALSRPREPGVEEVELVKLRNDGKVEVIRRPGSSFMLTLGETTAQDLISQLGPPDAIHRKHDRKMSIHKHRTSSRSTHPPFIAGPSGQIDGFSDTDRSSTHTDYSSPEDDAAENRIASHECFFNYYNHGIDVFISYPSEKLSADATANERSSVIANAGQLVATKLIIHGNVPGSYEFNRYRRSRWILESKGSYPLAQSLTSETWFSELSRILEESLQHSSIGEEEKHAFRTPMLLNRDWGDSPASSFDFADLRSSTDPDTQDQRQDLAVGTTRLYGFPGLLFEVLRNDVISCLTVY